MLVDSGLEVFGPVQVLDAQADAEVLVFFLGRAVVGELDDADLGWLPREFLRHTFHRLSVDLDGRHEVDTFAHGELAQDLAHDALLVLVQLQQVAAVRAERAEQVEDAEVLVKLLHDDRVLELVLDEVDVPHVPDTANASQVHFEPPVGICTDERKG